MVLDIMWYFISCGTNLISCGTVAISYGTLYHVLLYIMWYFISCGSVEEVRRLQSFVLLYFLNKKVIFKDTI